VLRDLLPPAGPRTALPVRSFLDLGALAEGGGYHSVWFPEGRGREAFAQLGALAAHTHRIHLGTGIVPVFSRPPALTAMALATLDDLTGGRVLFGIGAGHPAITARGYDRPFVRPVRAIHEYVEIVRLVMSGTPVHYEGEIFRVEEFTLESTPARMVPIFIAALRGRMLRLAGALGDGVLLNWMPPEHAGRCAAVVREAARAAGRPDGSVTVACFVRACVTDEVEEARLVLRRLIAAYAALDAYAQMFAGSGFGAEVEAIRAAWSGGVEPAARKVSDRMTEALGLIGTAAHCRAGLERFRAAGVDLPVVYPFPIGSGTTSFERTIAALAPQA
jgi:5,10-methylenetetrahydromethanopterin reductase